MVIALSRWTYPEVRAVELPVTSGGADAALHIPQTAQDEL